MVTRDVHDFVSRDWQAVRDSKIAYWGDRTGRLNPVEAFRVGEELRRQALLQDPAWPGAHLRNLDLEAHVRLAGIFRRAAAARRA